MNWKKLLLNIAASSAAGFAAAIQQGTDVQHAGIIAGLTAAFNLLGLLQQQPQSIPSLPPPQPPPATPANK